jgi:hypothetical protein
MQGWYLSHIPRFHAASEVRMKATRRAGRARSTRDSVTRAPHRPEGVNTGRDTQVGPSVAIERARAGLAGTGCLTSHPAAARCAGLGDRWLCGFICYIPAGDREPTLPRRGERLPDRIRSACRVPATPTSAFEANAGLGFCQRAFYLTLSCK